MRFYIEMNSNGISQYREMTMLLWWLVIANWLRPALIITIAIAFMHRKWFFTGKIGLENFWCNFVSAPSEMDGTWNSSKVACVKPKYIFQLCLFTHKPLKLLAARMLILVFWRKAEMKWAFPENDCKYC